VRESSRPTRPQQDGHDDDDQAKTTALRIALAPDVVPGRQRADQHQDQDDQDDA
jgi:hypothetical protein